MSDIVGSLINAAQQIANRTALAGVNALDDRESIAEFSSYAYLTPPVLFDKTILQLNPDVVHSISQYLLSVYSARYLMVVNRIAHVQAINTIALVNGAQDPGAMRDILQTTMRSAVNRIAPPVTSEPGMESVDTRFTRSVWLNRAYDTSNLDMMHDFDPVTVKDIQEVGMEADMDLSKPVNIAVGRMIKVMLGNPKHPVTVDVACALFPTVINEDYYMQLVTAFVNHDAGFIQRYQAYRRGEIKSFWDYITGRDLIQQDRYLTLHDNTGQHSARNISQIRAGATSFLTGQKQMNVASAMMVISDKLQRQFEGKLGGKFQNPEVRKRFFKGTGSMILCIVDPMDEMVTVYTRGMAQSGIYSFDQLKPITNSTNGIDLNAVMRAYNAGQQYNF